MLNILTIKNILEINDNLYHEMTIILYHEKNIFIAQPHINIGLSVTGSFYLEEEYIYLKFNSLNHFKKYCHVFDNIFTFNENIYSENIDENTYKTYLNNDFTKQVDNYFMNIIGQGHNVVNNLYEYKDISFINSRISLILDNSINNQYYDIYVMNLSDRTDRLKSVYDQFKNIKNIRLFKFTSIKDNLGELGNFKSVLSLLSYAKANNMKNICIIEDDIKLSCDELTLINIFDKLNNKLAEQFDIFNGCPTFFLNGNSLYKYKTCDQDFYRVKYANKSSFIVYNNNTYDLFLELNPYIFSSKGISMDYYQGIYGINILSYRDYICTEIESLSNVSNINNSELINLIHLSRDKYNNTIAL